MNLKEIEKAASKIQSELFKRSNSFAIGMLKSSFKGSGLQFKEHQVYVPGDDVRFIDWKLSAKTSHTYIKTFEEERNVEIYVVIDLTPTMYLGYKGISKLEAALEITCLLYLLAEKTQDKVKLIFIGEESKMLPSLSGHAGIAAFLSLLNKNGIFDEEGKIQIKEEMNLIHEDRKLKQIKSFLARRKEVVLLSDFSAYTDIKELNKILYKPNLHCFKLVSPLELYEKLPFSVWTKKGNKGSYNSANSKQENEEEMKGRIKIINVKDRYLDVFVREML